jgi:D-glycero-D-manno-heptose 1,7-bisphosphate phosphatase
MAGGKGTRVAKIANDIPKPMMRIAGKPILEHQLCCLASNNLKNITIVTGHLGDAISKYFGTGERFGVSVSYYNETLPLGTAGALFKMLDSLDEEILLINGDIIFDVDIERIVQFHRKKNALATLVTHPNSHPYDSSILVTNNEQRVTAWLGKEDERRFYKNEVNAGIHLLSKKLLLSVNIEKEKIDLDSDILKPALGGGGIFAYNTPEYIKDMGTPERFASVTHDVESGLVGAKNLSRRQRAIFLDRDGTINRASGFVCSPEELVLIDGAAEAIKKINSSGYLAIVITNQPVVARGQVSLETLEEIHRKLETDLGKEGAYLDAIYFCPHHPDKGFEGELAEYKIECECRKPKPGMLLQAAKKFNIDLTESWMTGDSWRDVEAGAAAGCKSAMLQGNETKAGIKPADGVPLYNNLLEFAGSIL